MRRARFFRPVFPFEIGGPVLREPDAGRAALLRAPVDQAVFADVEVARAGAAVPLIRPAGDQILLEHVIVRVRVEATAELRDRRVGRVCSASSGTNLAGAS